MVMTINSNFLPAIIISPVYSLQFIETLAKTYAHTHKKKSTILTYSLHSEFNINTTESNNSHSFTDWQSP